MAGDLEMYLPDCLAMEFFVAFNEYSRTWDGSEEGGIGNISMYQPKNVEVSVLKLELATGMSIILTTKT